MGVIERGGRAIAASGLIPTRRRSRLVDLGALTLAFVAGVTLLGAYATYRIWDVGRRDEQRPADAIVVLGAAQYNGTPSAVLAARLDHAIALYKQGIAPYFVVTGGKLPGDVTTEAETERLYATSHGVPSSAILAEETGRTTLESMQHVRAIFEQRGLRTAVFVSDRTHMLRVLTMAADQGIVAYGSPTTTSPTDTDPALHAESLQHELGALALYFLVEEGESTPRGPLTGRVANGSVASSPTPGRGGADEAESSAALATATAAAPAPDDSAGTGAPGTVATGDASEASATTAGDGEATGTASTGRSDRDGATAHFAAASASAASGGSGVSAAAVAPVPSAPSGVDGDSRSPAPLGDQPAAPTAAAVPGAEGSTPSTEASPAASTPAPTGSDGSTTPGG